MEREQWDEEREPDPWERDLVEPPESDEDRYREVLDSEAEMLPPEEPPS